MSFYQFKELFNKFAQDLAAANASNDDKKRNELIRDFRDDTERWAKRIKGVTSIAIEICNFMDPTFKQQFVNVMSGLQARDITLTVVYLLDEVKRLNDPENMLNELERKVYDAQCAHELAKKQLRQTNEELIDATRQLDECKQRNLPAQMYKLQKGFQEERTACLADQKGCV